MTTCPKCGAVIESAHTPNEECPRFYNCSVNKCPLHPDYETLYAALEDENGPGDPEAKCLTRRRVREEIATRYPDVLPNKGLTFAEIIRDRRSDRGKARWNALSAEDKARRLGKLAEFRDRRPPKRVDDGATVVPAEDSDS